MPPLKHPLTPLLKTYLTPLFNSSYVVDLDGDTIRYSIDKAAFEGATFAIDEFSGRITVGAGKQPIFKHLLNDLLYTGAGMALDYEAKAVLANNLLTPIKRLI